MNTFRIYEDFKGSLGDAAAKSLAQTLGAMFEELRDTVSKEDFRGLRESIDTNVPRLEAATIRLAEAQGRTEARVAELAEGQQRLADAQQRLTDAQGRTEARVAELAEGQQRLTEAQGRTEARVAELAEGQQRLTEAQGRTEARVAELAEGQQRLADAQQRLTDAQGRTEARVAELAEGQQRLTVAQTEMVVALQRLTIRTDAVVGRTFELQFRDRLTAYLGRFLRRGKLISNDELLEAIEPHVADREVDDFLRADAVAKGIVDGRPAYVVVEVSATGDVEDIVRAERRAAVLRKAGLESIPLVACDAISPESLAFAKQASVRVWCNGSMVDAAA
jgi:predicted  nucleic acid-binding Zn-ribbon protein